MARKLRGRPVHGVLLFDKPIDCSSNQALQRVKRLFQARKAGHTGSLDNLATGLLPICFGEATKLSGYLLDSDKSYLAECQLGITTETGDAEGDIVAQRPVPELTTAEIKAAMQQFVGEISQVPPMYSALKHQGQALYKLARQGQTIERKARQVTINDLQLLSLEKDRLRFQVSCSKGTYVRTLAEDIGESLSCGAHITMLRRLRVGQYDEFVTWEQLETTLEKDGLDGLDKFLLPPNGILPNWQSVTLDSAQIAKIHQGQAVVISAYDITEETWVKMLDQTGNLLGLAVLQDGCKVLPKKVFQFE